MSEMSFLRTGALVRECPSSTYPTALNRQLLSSAMTRRMSTPSLFSGGSSRGGTGRDTGGAAVEGAEAAASVLAAGGGVVAGTLVGGAGREGGSADRSAVMVSPLVTSAGNTSASPSDTRSGLGGYPTFSRRLEAGIEVAWAMLCTKAAHRMSVGRFRTFFTPSLLLTRKFMLLWPCKPIALS